MRILTFAPNYLPATRYGGTVRSSHGLAKLLVARGHEVLAYTTNVDGFGVLDVPLDRPVLIDGVKVRYFPISTPRRIYYAPAIKRALDAEIADFDVLHVNGMFLWPGPQATRLARTHGVPYIVSPRGMLVPEFIAGKSTLAKRLWIAMVERRSLASAAAIHVTSQEEAQGVRRLGLDLSPLAIIANGVDPPEQPPAAEAIERVWAGTRRGQRVAFLARLDWTKGLDLAIDAVLSHESAAILIAGPDQIGLRAQLEPRLGRRGRFLGALGEADKWALLAGADVLLAPSLKESFGIAVAEALAIGTPVICTEGVGAAAIVRRIDASCVVGRRTELIAAALRDLLADDQRRIRFSGHAQEIMSAEFTWSSIACQMEETYMRAVAAARRVASRDA